MPVSRLFHSEIEVGKKEILKKQNVLHLKWKCLKYEMSASQELNGKSIEDARF